MPGARYEPTRFYLAPGSRITFYSDGVVEAQNPKGELLPGSYSQVHLPLPAGIDRWRVPGTSLLYRGDGLHLAVVDAQNHVHLHKVTIGKDFGSEIEILNGIDQQDRVIQSPPDSILEGAQVKVIAAN